MLIRKHWSNNCSCCCESHHKRREGIIQLLQCEAERRENGCKFRMVKGNLKNEEFLVFAIDTCHDLSTTSRQVYFRIIVCKYMCKYNQQNKSLNIHWSVTYKCTHKFISIYRVDYFGRFIDMTFNQTTNNPTLCVTLLIYNHSFDMWRSVSYVNTEQSIFIMSIDIIPCALSNQSSFAVFATMAKQSINRMYFVRSRIFFLSMCDMPWQNQSEYQYRLNQYIR